MPRLVVLVVCGLLLGSACHSTPRGEPELVAPALVVTSGHVAGSLLGGVGPEAALDALDARPEAALAYALRVEYVERDPRAGFAPASSSARLFATLRGGDPIAATGRTTRPTRIARGDAARALELALAAREFGRTRELAKLSGALPSGTLATLELEAQDALATPVDGLARVALKCSVARAADFTADVAFALDALAPAELGDPRESPEEAAARAPEPRRFEEEWLVVDAPLASADGPLVWIVPTPFEGGQGAAFVVFVEALGPASDAAAVERTLADCREAARGTQKRVQRVEDAEARHKELESALGSLDATSDRRSSLVFLAQATGAVLAGDLALAADDATLEAYVQSLPHDAEELARIAVDGSTLGFVLERGAFAFLAVRGAETPLAPELAGALVRRAGEVGRSSGALEDLAAGAKTIVDLERALVDGNRVALEDSTLGVRVRGFDWLAARGLAPAGYDPFAPAQERRAALAAAERAP